MREAAPDIWTDTHADTSRADEITWRRGDRWATLIYHPADTYKRLALMLYSPDLEHHPDPMQISADDEGVADMIAEPVIDLLREARVKA